MKYDHIAEAAKEHNKLEYEKHLEELKTDAIRNFGILAHLQRLEIERNELEGKLARMQNAISSLAGVLIPYLPHHIDSVIYGG